MGPDITVSRAVKSKVKGFGRVWDFGGLGAEFRRIEWSGR